jgi:tRNA threonylcarbamoyl adenosine modification protein YeaZ
MILAIDTTGQQGAVISLDGQVVVRQTGGSRDTVIAVKEALFKSGRSLTEITAITVATGPGSFTGVRVGIAVARTLGLMLGVPVNGQKATEPINPVYEKSKFD